MRPDGTFGGWIESGFYAFGKIDVIILVTQFPDNVSAAPYRLMPPLAIKTKRVMTNGDNEDPAARPLSHLYHYSTPRNGLISPSPYLPEPITPGRRSDKDSYPPLLVSLSEKLTALQSRITIALFEDGATLQSEADWRYSNAIAGLLHTWGDHKV